MLRSMNIHKENKMHEKLLSEGENYKILRRNYVFSLDNLLIMMYTNAQLK